MEIEVPAGELYVLQARTDGAEAGEVRVSVPVSGGTIEAELRRPVGQTDEIAPEPVPRWCRSPSSSLRPRAAGRGRAAAPAAAAARGPTARSGRAASPSDQASPTGPSPDAPHGTHPRQPVLRTRAPDGLSGSGCAVGPSAVTKSGTAGIVGPDLVGRRDQAHPNVRRPRGARGRVRTGGRAFRPPADERFRVRPARGSRRLR